MRVGVTLPSFTSDTDAPLRAAELAEAVGLDGVFSFDHLWPMGRPGGPALWSFGLLAAAAARTDRVHIGPLVARVGLLPDADLLGAFTALADVAGKARVIAGLGSGDRLSAPENRAYGVPYPHARVRLADVESVAASLIGEGYTTWVGGRSRGTGEVARRAGAARNLWGVPPEELAAGAVVDGQVLQVTWGGQVLVGRSRDELGELLARFGARPGLVSGTVEEVAAHLTELRAAGATWCVCSPLDYITRPEEAVERVGLVRNAIA